MGSSGGTATLTRLVRAPIIGEYEGQVAASDGVHTGVNTMTKYDFPTGVGVDLMTVRFANSRSASSGEGDALNPITLKATIGPTATGPWCPLSVGGKRTITLDGGPDVDSDPIPFHVAPGGTLYVKTFLSVTSGQFWYPQTPAGAKGTTYWCSQSNGEADLSSSQSAFTATTGTVPYAPVAIIDERAPSNRPSVAVIGDSIGMGLVDSVSNMGFFLRALRGQLCYQRIAVSGNTIQAMMTTNKGQRRLNLIRGCNFAFDEFGTNDIVANSRTLAQLQADKIALWTLLAGMGVKVSPTTLIPRATSTDLWVTPGNQTPFTSPASAEPVRLGYNAWIRAGSPIDPTTHAAVAIGTSGALVAGQVGHPSIPYTEVADSIESLRDSGVWKAPPAGQTNYYTNDGTHPSGNGNIALAVPITNAIPFIIASTILS
jgi:hypothetical protein